MCSFLSIKPAMRLSLNANTAYKMCIRSAWTLKKYILQETHTHSHSLTKKLFCVVPVKSLDNFHSIVFPFLYHLKDTICLIRITTVVELSYLLYTSTTLTPRIIDKALLFIKKHYRLLPREARIPVKQKCNWIEAG